MAERERYDVIVVGLGAAGSASVYQLALCGSKVLGIDQYEPPHSLGSTHGDTRITRQAIGEGDHYTALSLRSYEIFRDQEKQTGEKLLDVTGGLMISCADSTGVNQVTDFFETTLRAANKFSIRHESFDAKQARARFPLFKVQDNESAYYEYEAGFLRPEACVRVNLALAEKAGARLNLNEEVLRFSDDGEGVVVETNKGSYYADRLVLTVGPWLPQMLQDKYKSNFRVYRQVLYWFDISENYEAFKQGNFPIFIWPGQGGRSMIYGFPASHGKEGGIKIASEQYEVETTPQTVERTVSPGEMDDMYERCIKPCLPGVGKNCIRALVCLYTMTPDSGFVLDFMPGSSKIIVCSPCSGHGFKHSAAIGECVAEMACHGKTSLDIEPLRFDRRALVNA